MVDASDPSTEMFLSGKWEEDSYADEDWIVNCMRAVSRQVGGVAGCLEIAVQRCPREKVLLDLQTGETVSASVRRVHARLRIRVWTIRECVAIIR
eukprot:2950086-Rhodomonas_salina.1